MLQDVSFCDVTDLKEMLLEHEASMKYEKELQANPFNTSCMICKLFHYYYFVPKL